MGCNERSSETTHMESDRHEAGQQLAGPTRIESNRCGTLEERRAFAQHVGKLGGFYCTNGDPGYVATLPRPALFCSRHSS